MLRDQYFMVRIIVNGSIRPIGKRGRPRNYLRVRSYLQNTCAFASAT